MFRNQYDNDVTIWSPQGRLHQVEYAMEAVKQGSATVGVKNKTHAVLAALKRASSELSAYQKKIIPTDDHMGMSIAGLTADARFLSRYMRTECLNHRYSEDRPIPVSRMIQMLSNKMQVCTQRYDRRPYGVGLLVAGYDEKGPHIYQTCPSASFFDCRAMAIGARSQSARTYLENHLDQFLDTDLNGLVKHALLALRDTLPNEVELTTRNTTIAIVGKGHPFTIYEDDGPMTAPFVQFLKLIEGEERRGGGGAGAAGADDADPPQGDQPPAAEPMDVAPQP